MPSREGPKQACAAGHHWHALRRRKILITGKCTTTFKHKTAGLRRVLPGRVDRYSCIAGRCVYQVMSAETMVTKTKTALKQETYNLSDLKH